MYEIRSLFLVNLPLYKYIPFNCSDSKIDETFVYQYNIGNSCTYRLFLSFIPTAFGSCFNLRSLPDMP
uniref:Ovule protein n=1 Tax=Caenorhabditis tropicalis TaxID=1561998 RepID=A0A1I7UBW7_9PELO